MKKNNETHQTKDKKEEKEPKAHKKNGLSAEIEKLKSEKQELSDKYMRLAAEFENTRKRWQKDKEESIKFANYILLKDIIVFADEMEQAISMMNTQQPEANHKTFVEGVQMTCKKLKDLLVSEGVKELNPANESFDPYFHEILAQEEKEGIQSPMVAEVFQKGYLFNDKLLRTAKVKVYIPKKETKKENAGTETPEEPEKEDKNETGEITETEETKNKE